MDVCVITIYAHVNVWCVCVHLDLPEDIHQYLLHAIEINWNASHYITFYTVYMIVIASTMLSTQDSVTHSATHDYIEYEDKWWTRISESVYYLFTHEEAIQNITQLILYRTYYIYYERTQFASKEKFTLLSCVKLFLNHMMWVR